MHRDFLSGLQRLPTARGDPVDPEMLRGPMDARARLWAPAKGGISTKQSGGKDMFARVTHYKMKSGSVDAAIALMEELKPRILALDGLVNFINMMQPDGSGYVISIVESEAKSDANAPHVAALWSAFADHLEAAPQPQGYAVTAHWTP
jgi:hypothetical protein